MPRGTGLTQEKATEMDQAKEMDVYKKIEDTTETVRIEIANLDSGL